MKPGVHFPGDGPVYSAPGHVNSIVFDAGGTSVFIASNVATYRVRVADAQVISEYPGLGGIVQEASLSPDGRRLAMVDSSQSVRVWDVDSRSALWSSTTADDPYAVAWSGDGSMIATGEEDGIIEVWDAKF